MNTVERTRHFFLSRLGYATFAAVLLSLVTAVTVASFVDMGRTPPDAPAGNRPVEQPDKIDSSKSDEFVSNADSRTAIVQLDARKLDALGLEIEPVRRGQWLREVRVTGRLELNESKVAHVSALVTGVVREICVEIGQEVRAGEVLAYIDSREVGEAKLQFAQNKLELEFANETHEWYETVQGNTKDLLTALENGQGIDEIEKQFRNRPIGHHREQLVSAFARAKHATADYDRIRVLGEDSVLPEREVIHAKAEYEAARGSYQALLEQIKFDSQRQLLLAHQGLKAAETALAMSRSQLFILGFSAEDILKMDPIAEEERVAYYPVRAPFGGTIIDRNVVQSKHVDAESDIVKIADLSTVWLRADIFEKDLVAVHGLQGKPVDFRTTSYPDQPFSAKVFSLGNVVDDQTRAARLLAVAQNTQRLLKPGMFVEIDLNSGYDGNVILVPASAVQRHAGATFTFVRRGRQQFERRDVRIGRSTAESVEILDGLDTDESVVVRGGFALKSEMLSELMVEE